MRFGRHAERTRWIILAALIGVGLVTAFWQIRVFSPAAPLAALPASYVVLALTDRLARSVSAIARAFITALLCLPLSSVTYALALPHDDTSHAATLACQSPQALAPLATLPPGLVLAPIDSGSHIISEPSIASLPRPITATAPAIARCSKRCSRRRKLRKPKCARAARVT
jgi:hypothetical protein